MNKGFESDIPKYRKRKESNRSKSKSKSNHKHIKKECLLIVNNSPFLANYCVVCGKILTSDLCWGKCEGGGHILLSREEALKKYKDFEQFTVSDYYTKYVPLNVIENESGN